MGQSVAGTFDVCIVGGSCTGVFAAVRAAEAGMRVAIIEKNMFLGGPAETPSRHPTGTSSTKSVRPARASPLSSSR